MDKLQYSRDEIDVFGPESITTFLRDVINASSSEWYFSRSSNTLKGYGFQVEIQLIGKPILVADLDEDERYLDAAAAIVVIDEIGYIAARYIRYYSHSAEEMRTLWYC